MPMPGAENRLKVVAVTLKKLNPDVVFLQEVWGLGLKVLNLPGYVLLYEKRLVIPKGGLVILLKKGLDFSSIKFHKYHFQGKFFSKQLVDRVGGKGFLDVFIPKMNLHLVDTHLLSDYADVFKADLGQKLQLDELMSFIKTKSFVLGAGDFNFDEDSIFYQHLIKYVKNFTAGIGPSYPANNRKVDFIVGKGKKLGKYKARYIDYSTPVSDHKGVILEVDLK